MNLYFKWVSLIVALGCLCLVIFFVNHRRSTPRNTSNDDSDQSAPVSESVVAVLGNERTESSGTRRVESSGESSMAGPAVSKPTHIPATPEPIEPGGESEKPKQKPSGLGLYVLPDRIIDRSPEHIQAEYLCGMPIVLSVRLVNLAAKYNEPDAASIKVSRLWADDVSFDVTLSSRSIESFDVKSTLERKEKEAEQQLDLSKTDLEGVWIVEGQTTAKLDTGLYRVAPSFRSIHATPILIKLIKPSEPESGLQIMIQEAKVLYRTAQYEEAIEIADRAMQEGGYLVNKNGEDYVILVSAASHEALGHYEEALVLYKKYKTGAPTVKPYPGMGDNLVDVKISKLEKLLQNKSAETP